MEIQNFKYKGSRVYYEVYGEGEPVIFLHGALLARPWNRVNQKIGNKYQVFDLALPGFDGNAVIKGRMHDFDLYKDVVKEFISHTKIKNPRMLGFSLGSLILANIYLELGYTSQIVLAGYPQNLDLKIGRLFYLLPHKLRRVLASNRYLQKKVIFKLMNGNLNMQGKADNTESFLNYLSLTDPASISDINYETVCDTYSKPTYNKLKELGDKVLFIYGEKDTQRNFGVVETYENIPGKFHGLFSGENDHIVKIILDHFEK